MPNPIKDSFDFVTLCYSDWYTALKQPWSAAARSLAVHDRTEQMKRATALWFSAFFLSLIIGLPIYYKFGLKLENLNFQLCALLAQYLTLLGGAFLFHVSLRWHHLKSGFSETFALYTTSLASVGPFLTLLLLPATLRGLRITAAIKAQALPFWPMVKALALSAVAANDDLPTLLVIAAQPVGAVGFVFVISTFVQLLSEHYGYEEALVVRAVAFAIVVLFPFLIIAVTFLQEAMLFVFISSAA